jgi:hypothetical protein
LRPQVHHRHPHGVGEGSTCSSHTRSSSVSGLTDGAIGAQQDVQHAELLGAQRHRAAVAVTSWRAGSRPRRRARGRLLGHGVAALQRVQAGDDLGEGERLGQVVVGAEVEPLDARARRRRRR